jgi:hypothetical protein
LGAQLTQSWLIVSSTPIILLLLGNMALLLL